MNTSIFFWLLAMLLAPSMASAEPGRILSADHRVDITVEPAAGTINGSAMITLVGSGAVRLSMPPWIALEHFTLDGRPLPPQRVITLGEGDRAPRRLSFAFTGTLETPTRDAMIATEGTFLPASSGWFPRIAAQTTTYRVKARIPDPDRVVVTGRLESEATVDGMYEATFVADYPPEGPSLFAGPYIAAERDVGGIRLRTYFYPDIADFSADYLERAGAYIQEFSERIGPYPFADFHIIAAPLPVGLGFPDIIYIARQIVPQPFMRGRSLAHEVLHNWWGNGVYVDYASGNWSEGLTTYMADYAMVGREDGVEGQRDMRFGWLRDFAALPADQDIPARQFRGKHGDRDQVIGYGKVSLIFHMLRDEIGDAAFDAGLKRLWREKRFEVASWADLQRVFEDESGRGLSPFFRQWLDRAGAPTLRFTDAAIGGSDGGDRLHLVIRQTQPPYELKVPARVTMAGGGAFETSVPVATTESRVDVDIPGKAREIALDPGYDIFRRLAAVESPPIFRDVTLHPAAATVVTASDAHAAEVSNGVARMLLGPNVRFLPPIGLARFTTPLLIVGTTREVDKTLADAGFDPAPPSIADEGTSQIWVSQSPSGAVIMVVRSEDADGLSAIARLLPHYRKMSRLAFDGGKAIIREVGPPGPNSLVRTFGDR